MARSDWVSSISQYHVLSGLFHQLALATAQLAELGRCHAGRRQIFVRVLIKAIPSTTAARTATQQQVHRGTVHPTLRIHPAAIQLPASRPTLIKPTAATPDTRLHGSLDVVPPAIDFSCSSGAAAAVQLRRVSLPGRL